MSEQHRKHGEALQPLNHIEQHTEAHHEKIRKHLDLEAEKAKHEHKELIETIQEAAEKAATSKTETLAPQIGAETKRESSPVFINKELKDLAYRRSLIRIRKKLSIPDKAFSAVIHQPAIEKLSEIGSKTVGRPSGMLGASVIAFVGGTAYFLATKYYGYDYSFFVFIGLLIFGFAAGLSIELLVKLLRRK